MICPSCRKRQEVLSVSEISCRRCGCDLTSLVRIKESYDKILRRAVRRLGQSKTSEALELAEMAWRIDHREDPVLVGLIAAVRLQSLRDIGIWLQRKKKLSQG